ncbi:MAG: exopolyphosphatase [Lachnospiraceae bacterium]
MKAKLFGAIDVGSHEVVLKIYEYSYKSDMKEIDTIRYNISLGVDTLNSGKISAYKIDTLCHVLLEFKQILKSYKIEDFRAYGTSAIRETENTLILLDQIKQRTGIKIEALSNSEQRFLSYKSLAAKGEIFHKTIEKDSAIIDMGDTSIQMSVFSDSSLIATQNMRLGVVKIREQLQLLNCKGNKIEDILDEMVTSQLALFKKLFLKDGKVDVFIVVSDYISTFLEKSKSSYVKNGFIDHISFEEFVEELKNTSVEEITDQYDITMEDVSLLLISAMLIRRAMKTMDVKQIWFPTVSLCDGIAYEYGERYNLLSYKHDFEKDILACTRNISKRYMGSRKRGETLENISLAIFDSMKKKHGLGSREKLLLRIATLLHDCGKYISITNLGECSYQIIMSTEIIGISHLEREIVANTVMYNHSKFGYYDEIRYRNALDQYSYMTIAKLTAILKVANGLDRSHKQKFKDIKAELKGDNLELVVISSEDITLEKGLFNERADFFEEVFSVRPIIKQKNTY